MEISPLDIRNQTFKKKGIGGLDPEEVSAFLEQVAVQMETLMRTRTEVNERLKITEERVNYYKLMEKTLQDAVLTMQKTVDEKAAVAEKEAELIIAEAKAVATRETDLIRTQANDLRAEIENLKSQKRNYFIRIRSLIKSQSELLDAMERDNLHEDLGQNTVSKDSMMFRKKKIHHEHQQNLQEVKQRLKETGEFETLKGNPTPPPARNSAPTMQQSQISASQNSAPHHRPRPDAPSTAGGQA